MTIDTQGRPFGGAIMNIEKGEKMYKVYRFIPKKNPGYHFEYRILTKLKKNGNLALAAYNYKVVDGVVEKGDVMTSDDVPIKDVDGLIKGVQKSIESASPSDLHIIDLTKYKTLEEQIQMMVELDKVNTQYVD
ncbi:MAG: hypothetical protein H8E70_09680 [Candidatus Marinimicrobia bacterium]|nr:hypothetical protein [Candidatus Neomarinimicrobiota bacterium]